jgi:hypothetical protein
VGGNGIGDKVVKARQGGNRHVCSSESASFGSGGL